MVNIYIQIEEVDLRKEKIKALHREKQRWEAEGPGSFPVSASFVFEAQLQPLVFPRPVQIEFLSLITKTFTIKQYIALFLF